MNQSFFDFLGLPEAVVVALYLGAIGAIVASFIPGSEFGGMKLPRLSVVGRKRARLVGFVCILLLILLGRTWPEPQPVPLPPIPDPETNEDTLALRKCTDPQFSVPLGSDNLQANGREHRVLNGFRVVAGMHDSTKCNERYTASWTASAGNVFMVEEGGTGVSVLFIGRKESLSIKTSPNYGPGIRFVTAISVDAVASERSSLSSRTCGAEIELTALHVPKSCMDTIPAP